MTTVRAKGFACGVAILGALGLATSLHAQISIGTWVKQSEASAPGAMTMTVEACCKGGRRLTYHMVGSKMVMTIESPFDGSEASMLLDGKPSGETMAIKRLDDRHTIAVVKMNGKPYGTSRSTLSADGKTLTVESDYTSGAGGQATGKQTEIWVRK
jgi:hypothetical protein